jgi:hypothetical protein
MKEDFINSNLIQPIFFGFGIVTFILIYFMIFKKINTQRLIHSSIYIIRFSGILFLLLWCFSLIKDENLINRFKGKYWFSGWFLMFTYPVLSQLFWFKKIRNSNLLTYLISMIFIISNLIFSGKITYFDGNYDTNSFLMEILKQLGIYISILFLVTFFIKKMKLTN